jgi:quercetin dioxygenase-like cupin family protein
MDRASFAASLKADGYEGPLDRRMEAGVKTPEHTHPFDARLMVLEGEYRLTCGGTTRHYGPGDVFEVAANVPHAEAYGPEGATFVVGRRALKA